jgi:hypothetical protein
MLNQSSNLRLLTMKILAKSLIKRKLIVLRI